MHNPYQNPRSIKQFQENVQLMMDRLNELRHRNPKPFLGNVVYGDVLLKHYISAQLDLWNKIGMPKKLLQDREWKGFVNLKLNEEQKALFLSWDVHDDDVWLLFTGLLTEGYKISSSYNGQNSTYNVLLTCNNPSSPNAGFGLSAYSPNWYNAVRLALFKHEVIFQGVWDLKKAQSPDDNWG